MDADTFQERLDKVHARIAEACARAGRDPAEVELVAVSKKVSPEVLRVAADCGVQVLGESKVQEARAKVGLCPGHLTWHLVGHLQTNKARPAVELFDTIHSVDSTKLLQALGRAAEQVGRSLKIYIEVNVSGEGSKFGVAPDALRDMLEMSVQHPRLDVVGLMTIPPFFEEVEKARPFFRQLRELRDQCRVEWNFPLDGLSMGMSGDFEIAVEEGSTCVRVGTALFGAR
jgi:pyridoxal phosphate enzyme (YggS family)